MLLGVLWLSAKKQNISDILDTKVAKARRLGFKHFKFLDYFLHNRH